MRKAKVRREEGPEERDEGQGDIKKAKRDMKNPKVALKKARGESWRNPGEDLKKVPGNT